MNSKSKYLIYSLLKCLSLIIIVFLININEVHAQEGPDDPIGDTLGDETGDEETPLDGGVSLLVAAGIAYGLKKRHESQKNVEV